MNESGYPNLPPEILIKIFQYLDFYDIQSVRLCCRQWFAVAALPEFASKGIVKLMSSHLDGNHPAAEVIFNKNIEKLCLKNVQFGEVDQLFQHIGNSLKFLTLKMVPIAPAVRLTMQYFLKLQSLHVCRVKLNTFAENLSDLPIADFSCLKELQLVSNESSINKYFLNSLQQENCLERLSVDFTQNDEPEILKAIETQSGSLKQLDLQFYEGKQLIVQEWCRVFRDLNLLELSLQGSFCIDIITSAVYDLGCLRSLDLTGAVAVDDGFLQYLVDRTPVLEKLNLAYCGRITDHGVINLRKLLRIKSLDVTCCNMVTPLGVYKIIAEPRKFLQELHLQEMPMSEREFSYFRGSLTDLRALNLSGCGKGITDEIIVYIFIFLRKIRELWLDNCTSISDAGILGLRRRIGSIQFLTQLEHLSLRGCRQITDASLVNGLRLPNLKFLDISYCGEMTNDGLRALVDNCPILDVINFTRSYGITEEGVRSLIMGLKRLRVITINNCGYLSQIVAECWNQSPVRTYEDEITLRRHPRNM